MKLTWIVQGQELRGDGVEILLKDDKAGSGEIGATYVTLIIPKSKVSEFVLGRRFNVSITPAK